jgi:copper chaperone CopZ
MKRAIIVRGTANIGKTRIIYSIYDWVITTYCVKPITNAIWTVDGGHEVRAVLEIGKLKIGIGSTGDNVEEVDQNLDEFFKHNVDIIICACRTRGYSYDTVRERLRYPDYVTTWCQPEEISSEISTRVKIAIEEVKALLIGLSK